MLENHEFVKLSKEKSQAYKAQKRLEGLELKKAELARRAEKRAVKLASQATEKKPAPKFKGTNGQVRQFRQLPKKLVREMMRLWATNEYQQVDLAKKFGVSPHQLEELIGQQAAANFMRPRKAQRISQRNADKATAMAKLTTKQLEFIEYQKLARQHSLNSQQAKQFAKLIQIYPEFSSLIMNQRVKGPNRKRSNRGAHFTQIKG